MKLILTNEVSGLGAAGDVVDVKDGYGRNFLLPRGLAVGWTKGGQKQVDAILAARAAREIRNLDDAKAIKAALEGTPVTVAARAGKSGRLFGAVTQADLADAVAASGGPAVDKRKIVFTDHVKTVGSYRAVVKLHQEIEATVQFEVVAD